MAETGVREAGTARAGNRNRGNGSFFKKNKALVLGGGGVAAILLLSHKGSASGGSSGTGSVTAGELGAYQQGIQDAGSLSGLSTGDSASSGSSGNGSGSGSGAPTTETVTINQGSGSQLNTGANDKVAGADSQINTGNKAKNTQTNKGAGKPSTVKKHTTKKSPAKPKEPPTSSKGHTSDKDGKHKDNDKHDSKGHKKKSPVEVESMLANNSGIVVMGKHFPGATGHTMGAPRRTPGGIVRDVTVHYGGHSETHTVGPNGRSWEMFTRGKNPPSARGTTQLVAGGGVH